MTITDVNKIFLTKYPNGEIHQKGAFGGCGDNRVGVVYDSTKEGCKVYSYQYSSYAQLLQKLGFNVFYDYDIKNFQNQVEELKKDIALGGYIEDFFADNEFIPFDEDILESKKFELQRYEKILSDYILV